MPSDALIAAVREGLQARADPVRAPGMQAYLKSTMPCLGVYSAGMREVLREGLAAHAPASLEDWRDSIAVLWRTAMYREERHLAIALASHRRYRDYRTSALLPFWEELIVTGAWWDLVDPIASHLVGEALLHEHDLVAPTLRTWSTDENVWKRRTSIIAQLLARDRTDTELLFRCIEPNRGDSEFFIRKAIGWALREYSKTDGVAVRRYVETHELSPLSRREALKWLEHRHTPRSPRRPGASARRR
jgi:3-methyladenine DNA glycosylase AlkD